MYVGVDIGASKTLVAAGDNPASLKDKQRFPTPKNTKAFIALIKKTITAIVDPKEITAIGVAIPGPVQNNHLVTALNLPWRDLDVAGLFNWTSANLYIENDAALGGLGEARVGAGRMAEQLLYVTVSTGIGTGLIIRQSIPSFTSYSEGGQMIIDYKNCATFENLASGRAFLQRYGRHGRDIDDSDIWSEYGELLGTGIHNLSLLTRPDVIVIGGSMGRFFQRYEQALRKQLDHLNALSLPDFEVRAAKYPDSAVVRGCICYAQEGKKNA